LLILIISISLFFGCFGPVPDLPENPGSCSTDSNCIGIIHPTGQNMCVGKHWIEAGGGQIAQINESYKCECVPFEGGEFAGVITGKVCTSKN
ncbi:MAG: hypothetical protein HON47_00235, partial [Candidatus Diapherotrites archaeon]|nr:hypothetical protein [Candidatus Diapherotrites archaeon]